MSLKVSHRIPKLILFLALILSAVYLIAKLAFPLLAPNILVSLTFAPTACETIDYYLSSYNYRFGITPTFQTINLSPGQTQLDLPISAATRTLQWRFCPGVPITITGLSVNSTIGTINLSLADQNHLICFDCDSKTQSNGQLLLSPNPSQVTWQLGGIYEYTNQLLGLTYKLYYRLPQLITALFLLVFILSAFPLTPKRLVWLIASLATSLFLIFRWHALAAKFPPATYGPNQIIGAAQYQGFSLTADFYLLGLLLLLPLFWFGLIKLLSRL